MSASPGRVLTGYLAHYNAFRSHRSLRQLSPTSIFPIVVAEPIVYSSMTGLPRQSVRAASAWLITDLPDGVSFQAGAVR